jgi:hypothetical protein
MLWTFEEVKGNKMKLQSCFLISILLLLILIPVASADIMPPGMKGYHRCVSINNLSDYPDVVFVGHITGPVIRCENPYIINSSDCLTQGYKANTLTVYAIEKGYFNKTELDNIDFESDPNILPYIFDFNVEWDYTVIANPLTKEERYYSIAGFNDTALILYEERRVSIYGSVIDKEQVFEMPELSDIRSVINESKKEIITNNSKDIDTEFEPYMKTNQSKKNETSDLNQSEYNSSGNKSGLKDSIVSFFKRLFGNE